MENKKIKTPSGKEVVLNRLLTGRDVEYIEQPMQDIRIAINDKGKIGGEVKAGDAKRESLHRALEKVVLTIEGKDATVDDVLNLPAADYKAIVLEVDKIVSGEDFQTPISTP